ncbi:hypothetical protein [Alteromonas stellipolaris]|uniref:hypothetical protein n=1 Tax=Alteromonas stellipolaris TaxID=233316 RepID=UPI0026E34DFD|nr:hypothetical protein [Alteromonas stellipolaris]MDO6535349.1 hypothetical protein [Alteromonas stellipolaris]MDO6627225.1 hypothetical protein [Alteromonas stellipolaris]
MIIKKEFLIAPLTTLLLIGYGDSLVGNGLVKVQLDNVELCLEKQYASDVLPPMLSAISSKLDNSYDTIRVVFEPDELISAIDTYEPDSNVINGKKRFTSRGVIFSSKSAVTGFSHAGELLLDKTRGSSEAFEYDEGNKAFRVYLHNSRTSWSFVRNDVLPDNVDKYTIQDWEMAYCSKYQYDKTFSCIVQRIHEGVHYQTSIDEENFKNFDKYESFIHQKIEHWKRNCELETDHAI